MKKISKYEITAIEQAGEWGKEPQPENASLWQKIKNPFAKTGALIHKIPGFDRAVEKTFDALMDFFSRDIDKSMLNEGVYHHYRTSGFPMVRGAVDIEELSLEDIDQVVGQVCGKYQALVKAMPEDGQPTEALQTAPTDIVALIGTNHQAILEYAAYYGFDITSRHERIFALNILEYAATTNEQTKIAVLKRLVKQIKEIAHTPAKSPIDKPTFMDVLKTMTNSLTIHLMKAKIGQNIPIQGAVIGTGFNAYFTGEVCDVASFLYKQKFLAKKYGQLYLDILPETSLTSEPEEEQENPDLLT